MAANLQPETRAAVEAGILTGQSGASIAQELKINQSSVSRAKTALTRDLADNVPAGASEKRKTIIDLVERHLTASLEAASSIAERVRDDDQWFRSQNAHDLAILHGVLTDKSLRVLEAIKGLFLLNEGTAEPPPEPPIQPEQ